MINSKRFEIYLNEDLDIPKGTTLSEFLTRELKASSLNVKAISDTEISVNSDSIVRVHLVINEKEKTISFDLYSPRWSRRITVQQLNGFEFMESRAQDQMDKENSSAIAEDTLLALDMIRYWALKNNFKAMEVSPEIQSNEKDPLK